MTEEEKEKLKDAIALLQEADKEFERSKRHTDIVGNAIITTFVVSCIIFLAIGALTLLLLVNS